VGGYNTSHARLLLQYDDLGDDVVFETKLQDFEGPEAVTNQYLWFLVSLYFSLGIF
jgi:hypothetical protein